MSKMFNANLVTLLKIAENSENATLSRGTLLAYL